MPKQSNHKREPVTLPVGPWLCRLVYDRHGRHRVPGGDVHLVAVPSVGDVVLANGAYAVQAVLRTDRPSPSRPDREAQVVLRVSKAL